MQDFILLSWQLTDNWLMTARVFSFFKIRDREAQQIKRRVVRREARDKYESFFFFLSTHLFSVYLIVFQRNDMGTQWLQKSDKTTHMVFKVFFFIFIFTAVGDVGRGTQGVLKNTFLLLCDKLRALRQSNMFSVLDHNLKLLNLVLLIWYPN